MNRVSNFLLFLCVSCFTFTSCEKDEIPPANLVPIVQAGPAQVTKVDNITLAGSASDTDGKVVSYLWSQVSGPEKAKIVNEGAPTTRVTDLKNGTYLFQLMATDDKGATGVDTVSVQAILPVPQTLTLQPLRSPGDFQLIFYKTSNFFNDSKEFALEAWTDNGIAMTVRHVLKFDLSSIPANATILTAQLYLYSYPAPTFSGNVTEANYGSANGFYVRQISAPWTQSSVTWTNPPAVTMTNQVYVPHTNEKQLDLNLDMKSSVASMVANNTNYGWYFKLENEVAYTSRIFVNSYNATYPAKAPKLVVTYQ